MGTKSQVNHSWGNFHKNKHNAKVRNPAKSYSTPEKLKQLQRDFDNCLAVRETLVTTVWTDDLTNQKWMGRAKTFCGDDPHRIFDELFSEWVTIVRTSIDLACATKRGRRSSSGWCLVEMGINRASESRLGKFLENFHKKHKITRGI
jgi:hypothetical protein